MIEQLQKIIDESNNIVFFGGAGVSTESGIPDFRSESGLYKEKYEFPAEMIVSHSFFVENPHYFYKFYFDKLVYPNVLPNECHKKLKELEDKGKLKAIITQNIDGLHEMAGSKNVINLHGTIYSNHCISCGKSFSLESMLKFKGSIPTCPCGGIIKPDVVLYEEPLNEDSIQKSIQYIEECDTLIVGGTSLNVYPAAGLINYFKGRNLVVINKDKLNINNCLQINKPIAEVFAKIK
ncbi:MAG TPA: NAD-dependent protein deacylase [Bacilli bacterium]|jgi:NAD-dependent deacetylase|nr:NAD-dependent protein deacylase [Bacilli bacterium]